MLPPARAARDELARTATALPAGRTRSTSVQPPGKADPWYIPPDTPHAVRVVRDTNQLVSQVAAHDPLLIAGAPHPVPLVCPERTMYVEPRPDRLMPVSTRSPHEERFHRGLRPASRPGKVCRRLANSRITAETFRMNEVNVADTNPYPVARVSLIALH